MNDKRRRQVIVLDSHRGISYGTLIEHDRVLRSVTLENARHVFTFTCKKESPGVWGLAVGGPAEDSRIGPAVSLVAIDDVVKVLDCSDEAVKTFEKSKW